MGVSRYSNQISSQRVSVLLSYQYNDVLYSEAAEMFAELNTVLKKKKENLFTVVQCLVSSTAGKLRNSHTKRKDKKSSFSLYQCSSTMLFSPVFQHSLLLNVLYCVSSHQILQSVQFSYPFCMFLLFDPFLLFSYLEGIYLI